MDITTVQKQISIIFGITSDYNTEEDALILYVDSHCRDADAALSHADNYIRHKGFNTTKIIHHKK